MLISQEYAAQNAALHAARPDYGTSGGKWVHYVRGVANMFHTANILDYGCGKRTLQAELGFPIANYDPCIEECAAPPKPAELVVCTDVLEHIEPEHLAGVLDDLRRVTKLGCFLVVATRPAKKFLPDGRNAHLIQEPLDWWLPQLMQRWKLRHCEDKGGFFIFIGLPR